MTHVNMRKKICLDPSKIKNKDIRFRIDFHFHFSFKISTNYLTAEF